MKQKKQLLTAALAMGVAASAISCTQTAIGEESTAETTAETQAQILIETSCFAQDTLPGIDCIIDFPEGEDITILQVTDTQAMLYEGIRKIEGRWDQVNGAFFTSGVTDTYTRYWQYVEEGVAKTNPDLIVLTGDNIYGETDDSGELWLEMIDVLDAFEIPWLCIFGNHDNESAMGLNWQIQAVENSQYGFMRKGSTENGNCNYTVGIRQGGKLAYVFYMVDTNGCRLKPHNYGESLLPDNVDLAEIQQSDGIFPDQLAWMRECHEAITAAAGDVPSMMFMHIPPQETYYSVIETYADTYGTWPLYTDRSGDIGMAEENIGGFAMETVDGIPCNPALFQTAKEIHCVGMFMGHQHKVATSTMHDGIRLTYGLKTGTGDYHSPDMLGTTKITIKESDHSFDVEYIHSEIVYPLD